MNFYVIENSRLLVGWSPKCACTAVTDWLVHGVLQVGNLKREREYLTEHGFLLKDTEKAMAYINEGFYTVFFTRDPMARVASAFINKFVCRNGRPLIYPHKFEKFALNFIHGLYKHHGYSGAYKGISFLEFLSHIEFLQARQRQLNHHWSPQVTDLNAGLLNQIRAGHYPIVRQESFVHDLTAINADLGIDYLPGHRNISQWPKKWIPPTQQDWSASTNRQIIQAKAALTRSHLLATEAREKIAHIYHEDFQVFSYPS